MNDVITATDTDLKFAAKSLLPNHNGDHMVTAPDTLLLGSTLLFVTPYHLK